MVTGGWVVSWSCMYLVDAVTVVGVRWMQMLWQRKKSTLREIALRPNQKQLWW